MKQAVGALTAVVAVFLVAGCRGGTPTAQPTTDSTTLHAPSTSVSSASGPVVAGSKAIAAYRGMWAAYQDAIRVPDPASAALSQYATGDALSTLTKGLQSVKDQGLKGTGDLRLSPTVTELSPAGQPTTVTVRDCFNDSDTHLVRVGPGTPYDDKPGGKRLCIATVNAGSDGTWKVSSFGLREVGTCT